MRKNSKIYKVISVISAAALAVTLTTAFPENIRVFAEASDQSETNRKITVSDVESFLKLANNCRIDSASKGLAVELTADIDLGGTGFDGIPIFCGTFDGGDHTISGLLIRDSASETGLFRHVERGAVIKDLKVVGAVTPSGSGNMVGGIAGVNKGTITSCEYRGFVSGSDSVGSIAGNNRESGVISGCKSTAVISAESSAGGIVGMNLGVLIDCSNSGNINAVYSDSEIDTEDLELEDLTAENVIGKSDIGGVAGYSSGIIQRCSNSGTVGYQHTGYNIGGIVGRQSGMLNSCNNTGHVYGRKDVGGIAGQMEPYRSIEFSEDTAQQLSDEMDILSENVDKLISDARDSGGRINTEIQTLTNQMNAAQKNADTIADRGEEVFNGYSDGINEILARVDIALDGATPALNALDEALQLLGDFSDKCAEALNDVEQAGEYSGDAIEAARAALKDIDKALPEIETGLRDIGNSLREIQKSLGDPEKIKQSLKDITKSLDNVTVDMQLIANAARRLDTAFRELSNWLNGSDWNKLENSVTALSDSLTDVLDALGDISEAVSDIAGAIDTGEMQDAFSKLNDASRSLGRAAAKLAEAMQGGGIPDTDDIRDAADELQKAADALSEAADHLIAAVDPDEMQKALDELQAAAEQLQKALDRASKAAGDMSDALDKITSSSVPKNTMDTVSAQVRRILNSVSDMSGDLSDINGEIRDILDEIDTSGLSSAMKTLADAADSIANAVKAIDNSSDDIDKAAEALENAVDSLTSASSKAGDAAEIMSKASDKLSEAVRQLENITDTLSGKPEVRFPALDETFTSAADSLSDNMQAMISTISRIGSTANNESNVILDDVQAINDCLGRIFDIFKDTYKDLLSDEDNDRGFSEDISETAERDGSGDTRQGKALDCVNSGEVEGDVNVGGITGAMAIEFDLDPEDDIAQNGDRSVNFSYNVMDVIESCENLGKITAKKNYCGGIVGRMDMGLVKGSRSSGTITGTSGSYIGGIAGYSSAKLRNCAAKVTLSGAAYIGGIAGEGGIITDCLAISDITEFTEKIGALAGYVDFDKENAEISGNYFVDRGVAAIDRVSYAGIAEPMSYAEFAARVGSFADITIEFKADGETLGKVSVPYGGALKSSDIPEIPQKSGFYAKWEEFDFDNITFPRVLEAEYIQMLSSIACEKQNESGLPLVLADGSFDEHAAVLVETESSAIFAPEGSELRLVTVDAGNTAPTALRILKSGDNPKLMQYINGAWKPVSFTENGSYLIIKNPALENGYAAFCVSGSAVNTGLIITLAAVGAAVIIAVILIIIIVKKHKSRKQKKQEQLTK